MFEQKIIGHGKPIPATKLIQILKKGEESTCKIISLKVEGSGFFCKIGKESFLFTNNHVIDENFINNNNKLVTIYKKQEKIFQLYDRKKITNINLDFTMIEIKYEDNISDFFEIDDYIDSDKNQYLNKDIGILQYPYGNEFAFDKGELNKIEYFRLFHSVSTDYGSSGSPIFLIDNLKVIGIHNVRERNINSGIFMKNILDYLYNNKIINTLSCLSSQNWKLCPSGENPNFKGLNKIRDEDVIILLMKCPAYCFNENDIIFKNEICGSIQYINKNGEVICPKCGTKGNFFLYQFKCNSHRNYKFPERCYSRLIASFSLHAKMRTGKDKMFLKIY